MKTEVVRFHDVRCIGSCWRWTFEEDLDSFSCVDDLLAILPADEILHKLCKEIKTYTELKDSYDRAIREQKDNEDFIVAYKLNDRYKLWISPENKIYMIYFIDRLRVAGKRIIPWDYPTNIACIGYSNGHSALEIIQDFKKISTVDFHMKYWFCLPIDSKRKRCIRKQAEGLYIVDDRMAIRFDAHIYFYALKNHSLDLQTEKDVADSWLTDEGMLVDLTKQSMYRFGKEYLCYWI